MAYLPTTKWGDCTQCPNKNVACVKVKKDLVCIPCHRRNKGKEQVNKAQEKEKLRRGGNTSKVSAKTLSAVRKLANPDDTKKVKTKSELLKQADKVFGDRIKVRDTKNGKVTCPCCKDEYFADAVDGNGKGIIQPLHFVSRGVYDLRFDADNVHAGCCYCNLKQHLSPKGLEYQRYRKFLVNKIGETAVAEMELVKRKINRIEESQLKTVIEHYQQ